MKTILHHSRPPSLVLAWTAVLAILVGASWGARAAAVVITARLQFTNVTSLLGGTNAQGYTLNSSTRTYTNGVATPAAQILAGTTMATFVQRTAIQAARFPFTNVRMYTDNISNVWFTGSNDVAMALSLTPSTWGQVIYSTNSVGPAGPVMVPMENEVEAIRTNQATLLVGGLRAYSHLGLGYTNAAASNAQVKPLLLPGSTGFRSLEAGNGNVSLSMTATSAVINPSLTPAVNNQRITNALSFAPQQTASTESTVQLDCYGPEFLFWTNLVGHVALQVTNVWSGNISNRTVHLLFTGGASPYNVTITCPNPAGVEVRWGSETNGLTSFTVTNGIAVAATLRIWRTNLVEASWKWLR